MSNRILLSVALVVASVWPVFAMAAPDSQVVNAGKPALDVVMYATKACPYCVKARDFFTSRKVAWDERDIESSPAARTEWISLGGVGTPLILINGKKINGYSESAIEVELAKYR
ncbi:MAG: hypothetical protein IPP82_09335 [Xanthomonadales bacterium]|nr:hypothetical protein [Xanthomonadales bacterium]